MVGSIFSGIASPEEIELSVFVGAIFLATGLSASFLTFFDDDSTGAATFALSG